MSYETQNNYHSKIVTTNFEYQASSFEQVTTAEQHFNVQEQLTGDVLEQ